MKTANEKYRFLAIMGAAVTTAAASSLCCLGPLLYLAFGVSAAGLSGLTRLDWLRLPLLLGALLLVGYGFWRLYFSRRPLCAGPLSLLWLRVCYWLALPLILFFILYPVVLPLLLEGE